MDMDTAPDVTATVSASETADDSKPKVQRGARACSICRSAKMKCIGAEDGQGKCQRCQRTGADCVFEKHRRGRKPGSKLSEASKMLRKIEKGLHSDKRRSVHLQDVSAGPSHLDSSGASGERLQLPPISSLASDPPLTGIADDEDDKDSPATFFPAKLIRKEQQRSSFLSTILNPDTGAGPSSASSTATFGRAGSLERSTVSSPPSPPSRSGLLDPVDSGLLTLERARALIELLFVRLNPFINLFDPVLHTVEYIRQRSPFLFTTLITAVSKFFHPEIYKRCHKLAHEMAVQAFADGTKSVETVQAYACLTYWKEADDTRMWTYIGFACRMAVEIGLNRYVPQSPPGETELQMRERRNRERTYLVLFVHDRSLSMQTGRSWMLPVCPFVTHAEDWHQRGDSPIRSEDVIVAAFVQLRLIASETTDWFILHRTTSSETQFDMQLRTVNQKLHSWIELWSNEMRRAGSQKFHFSFISFFRNYVKLFLNSFGIRYNDSPNRSCNNLQAFSQCYTSAIDTLNTVIKDFAPMGVLRYGQDSITVMTAYSAVFLLEMLRSSNTLSELHEGAASHIYEVIDRTAGAYELNVVSDLSNIRHARYLRNLLAGDMQTHAVSAVPVPLAPPLSGQHTQDASSSAAKADLPRLSSSVAAGSAYGPTANAMAYSAKLPTASHQYSISPRNPGPPAASDASAYGQRAYPPPLSTQASVPAPDASYGTSAEEMTYWRSMFRELGFGVQETDNVHYPPMPMPDDRIRNVPPHPSQLPLAHTHSVPSSYYASTGPSHHHASGSHAHPAQSHAYPSQHLAPMPPPNPHYGGVRNPSYGHHH